MSKVATEFQNWQFFSFAVYFLIFSFLGWVLEVSYCALVEGTVVNRGFLAGPLCPIYGFGMCSIILSLKLFEKDEQIPIFVIFFGGAVLCSLIELIGGFLLKQIFGIRWWDYSGEKLNLGGYICLRFAIYWGIATVLVVSIIRYISEKGINIDFAQFKWLPYLLIILYIGVGIDFVVTCLSLSRLGKDIRELYILKETMGVPYNHLSKIIGENVIHIKEANNRILQAFPNILEELKK